LTNVGPTPIRAARAEAALLDAGLDESSLRQAGALAADEADPVGDLRGPADYKRAVVRTLTVRALRRAVDRAGARR
jgi:carbon-monoxide dehydrogenase medium subunit